MIYRIDKDMKPVPVSNPAFSNTGTNVPVGFMTMYAGKEIPDGFMPAWGQSLERAEYPELFKIIGTKFGATDDEHFNLPDTREAVIVGAGTNSKLSNDVYNEGQFKEHQFASHTHTQASHTHTGTNHCHSMSHSHCLNTHTHAVLSCSVMVSTCGYGCALGGLVGCTCGVVLQQTFSATVTTNAGNLCACQAVTLDVCSATATNNANGATSGGTHGKRMGIYYIIKVEADR